MGNHSEKNVERRQAIITLYQSGKSCREIAPLVGCTAQRVHQLLVLEQVERRPQASQSADAKKWGLIMDMARAGVSRKEIAAAVGYSPSNISRVCRLHGFSIEDARLARPTKRCSRCGEWKDRKADFSVNSVYCKPCKVLVFKEKYYPNRKKTPCAK